MAVDHVILFNPFVGSSNLGDLVIREACIAEIESLFPGSWITELALHQPLAPKQRKRLSGADRVFVAGSNMLGTRLGLGGRLKRWPVGFGDLSVLRDVVVMGAGWNRAKERGNPLGALLLARVLSRTMPQAVRDHYAAERLGPIVKGNVIVTGCPTLWGLGPSVADRIPQTRGQHVVTTLTDYAPKPVEDREMLVALKRHYKRVMLWPQGHRDRAYFRTLNVDGVHLLQPTLGAFDQLLVQDVSLDYVGTRVHGGIRAMQKGRRTRIIAVDHRGVEMGKTVNLPVTVRDRGLNYARIVEESLPLTLNIPIDAIEEWRVAISANESQASEVTAGV